MLSNAAFLNEAHLKPNSYKSKQSKSEKVYKKTKFSFKNTKQTQQD